MSKKNKEHLNLVIIGHIDHGKSTTMGHILVLAGAVSDREVREMEKIAKDLDRESFKFAYFMDQLAEERKRGITIDLAFRKFETESKYFTIIDAPGHQDFVKNMITGASQADAAVLVLSSKVGETEAGLSDIGQTREHAFLAKTLGIKQLVVAINKMDDESVNYSEKRYNEVLAQVKELLKLVGYKDSDVTYVPISAYLGENLLKNSDKMPWYKGPSLLQAIDQLKVPERPLNKPLRMPVQDVYKIKGTGVVPVGRIETGIMKVGQNITVMPGGYTAEVRTIEMHHEQLPEAKPGDNVGVNIRGITMKDIKRGDVVGPKEAPCTVVNTTGSMQIQGIVIWHPTSIAVGYTPVVHAHTAQIACKFIELNKAMDPKNNVNEDNPKIIKKGQTAIFTIQPIKKFPIEPYDQFPELGRVAIRDMGRTCVVGVVKKIKAE